VIALTAGVVHYLIQGQDYALPASPCQILCPSNAIMINGQYRLGSEIEPGTFNAGGGTIRNPDAANQPIVIKKHTIGTSKTQTPYSAAVLMDKPSYYWRLNEPSGIARELIQGLNGTVSGGVTYAQPGALVDGDKAMLFDGLTGKILTAGSVTLPMVVTVEGWIKTSSATYQTLFSTRNPDNIGVVFFGLDPNGFMSVFGGGGVAGTGGVSVKNGQWHHLVYIFKGTDVSLYIDGVFERTLVTSRTSTISSPASIGAEAGGNFCQGSIDEVAIYPRALTASEILSHYQSGRI
jgi:Concanavalin A-like lectin/glucanases superfamily